MMSSVAQITELLSGLGPGARVHLLGVTGVGMAGVALLLKQRGFDVTGCDLAPADTISAWLESHGIDVQVGHDPNHINEQTRLVIRSSAVPLESPELDRARGLGIPVEQRGQVLAALARETDGIAVAGTHGKTTVASFIAQVLRSGGHDPSFCIGAEVAVLGGVAGTGKDATLVVEADESDGTVAFYESEYAVVTNIEPDHMNHFSTTGAQDDCFASFLEGVRRKVFYCADDPRARAVAGQRPSVSYGLSAGARIRGAHIVGQGLEMSFTVMDGDKELGSVTIPVPGEYNVVNALAAIAVALESGIAFERISSAASKLELPTRRFECVVDNPEVLVISDYAHHPTEISALVKASLGLTKSPAVDRGPGEKRGAGARGVFQPHRYSRTRLLGPDFPAAFDGLDEVILVPVYAASEQPVRGGTESDLYALFREHEKRGGTPTLLARSLDEAWSYLRRTTVEGDTLLVVGAGDVEALAHRAAAEWRDGLPAKAERRPPAGLQDRCEMSVALGQRTSFGVGGRAAAWCRLQASDEASAMIRWAADDGIALQCLGGGSNVLVSDLGTDAAVCRLSGEEFRGIREDNGIVQVGAGLMIRAMLDWLEERGLSGLEFLAGVPGTVGGALRMNAGRSGGDICSLVAWAKCLDADGEEILVENPVCGYRSGIDSGLIVEAGLRVDTDDPAAIRARRKEAAGPGSWMKGSRCAGSVFRNPEGDTAGRLIEAAGLKGRTVGGATISDEHANVVVADEGARASDIIALMGIAKNEVMLQFGVELEPEIVVL